MNWQYLQNEPTERLITIFQNSDSTIAEAEAAFIMICVRFREDLLKKCEIVCSNYGHPPSIAEEIAETTFKNYERSRSFDINKMTVSNVDRGFKFYLYRISQRALTDLHRKQERIKAGKHFNGNEKIIKELPMINEDQLSFDERVKYKAISLLSDKEQAVFLTNLQYKKPNMNLPKHLRTQLQEFLGNVSPETVRWYKKVATDKVNMAIESFKAAQNS